MIKINETNKTAIEAALKAANGSAHTHTFTSFSSILLLTDFLDKRLNGLGISKADSVGAQGIMESGGVLPNAYKYTCFVTSVQLVRRSTGWFLKSANITTRRPAQGVRSELHLTSKQDAIAIKHLRSRYRILPN